MALCRWVVCRCQPLWISWPMLAVGFWHVRHMFGQQTQGHIYAIVIANRCHDEVLWPVVVPFIHKHDDAWPHVARICPQFLHAENIPDFTWPAYPPDMLPNRACLGCSGSMYTAACSLLLPTSSNLTEPLKWRREKKCGPTFQRPQSTTRSTLCEGDMLHCMRQMVTQMITPDTNSPLLVSGFRSS